jgi:hypothetical protein
MGVLQSHRHCTYCGRKTRHVRETFGDGAGCLLTVLTAGLFLPVWIVIKVVEAFRPFRCQVCGKGRLT